MDYPTNVKIIRVPCTGKVDALYLLKAGKVDVRVLLETFLGGVDGVLVVGCHEGDCHFQVGNVKARKRVARAQGFLEAAGIDPARLEMAHVAAAARAALPADGAEPALSELEGGR